MVFQDKEFPPTKASLGPISGVEEYKEFGYDDIRWVRLPEILKLGQDWDAKTALFKDGVAPDDVEQGRLGDCWLVSSFSCVAQVCPELIEERFAAPLDPDTGKPCMSKEGRYVIQLWDAKDKRWENVVIDDLIPVVVDDDGRFMTLGVTPKPGEAWVALLEKAFAKYMGNYAAIEGGSHAAAFRSLAGDKQDNCFEYRRIAECRAWAPVGAAIWPTGAKTEAGLVERSCMTLKITNKDAHALSDIKMFNKLRVWMADKEHHYLLGAGSNATPDGSDRHSEAGIYFNHAYGILNVVPVEGFTMIHLANPHGQGEWEGEWADDDSMWKEHPEVAAKCGYKGPSDDGMFWMQLDSFNEHYSTIYVLRLTKDVQVMHDELELPDWGVAEDEEDEELPEEEFEEDDDEEEEEEEEVDEEEKAFADFDDDGNGFLNVHELRYAVRSVMGHMLPRPMVQELVAAVGGKAKKGVDLEQFREVCLLAPYVEGFLDLDEDGSGSLDHEEVVELLKKLEADDEEEGGKKKKRMGSFQRRRKDKQTANAAKQLIKNFDEDGDGELSLGEFCELIKTLFVHE